MFIVVWDDGEGLCVPMTAAADCEGGICACCHKDKVALFTSRKAARRAITISTKYAQLCEAQGKVANTDFLGECRRCVRIVQCELLSEEGGE
jgi:hypothetical protein